MANEFLAQALEECKNRRYQNQQEEQRRLQHALALDPKIGILDQQRRDDILEGLSLAIKGITPVGIEERTRKRNQEIGQLLIAQNLPRDYLAPVHQCEICLDSGYVGEPRKKLCECIRRRYHELLSGEFDRPDSPSFERFDLNVFPETELPNTGVTQRQLMQVIRQHSERFAEQLPEGKKHLVLYGPSGLGKTYLLQAIAKRSRQRGILSLTYNANALFNQIRQAYFAREEEVDQPYYEVPLLLIDDLGTEPLWENITLEQLFALLEYRIQHQKSTVISTNLSPDNLRSRYTQRIYSRLMDPSLSLVLQFQGQDIRLLRKG